jgi:hypothetical protein
VVAERAEVAPIDLPLLPGRGFNAPGELAQPPALLAQGPQERAQDRTAARLALRLDLLVEPYRAQLGALDQATFEIRFERV